MIAIPFNFQPTSVSVKTSSYNIPTGSYAYVTAYVEDGGGFTIDGATALTSQVSTSSVGASVIAVSTTGTYAVPSGYIFEGQAGGSGVNGVTIGGTAALGTSNYYNTIRAGGGDTVAVSTSGGAVGLTGYAYRAYTTGLQETSVTASFWIPAGTNITGSGTWKATVSLFSELT